LVTFGFAHDIVSRAGNEWLEEQLDARVEARLLALRGQSTSA
jgi:hypothetical protein